MEDGYTGITEKRNGEIKVYFPMGVDKYKSFSPVRLPAHETTWAMTIHKSQGSEFNPVAFLGLPKARKVHRRFRKELSMYSGRYSTNNFPTSI